MSYQFREPTKSFILALALGCLFPSIVVAQAVETSYLHGIDFSKFHTYKWVEVKGGQHPDPAIDTEIRKLIDSELAAKGLAKTDASADLSVDYQVALTQEEKWADFEGWTAELGGPPPEHKTIDVGTLVIDIYDTTAKKLVWTGKATKTVDHKSTPKQRRKAIQALLRKFPPK